MARRRVCRNTLHTRLHRNFTLQLISRRLDPENATGYNDRGNVYLAKGDPDRALADINAAIRLDPKNAEFHDNL
ncbi:MAG: tetratricopeptide repeat protein, partial [Methyloceanibacter sp.]|nr:tetratricopeptide repeat protein [Methyloceanibacter sp.]